MLDFLRSRQWIIARLLFLVGIGIILAIRQYGNGLVTLLRRPTAPRHDDITLRQCHPDLAGTKPAWIIGFRNNSNKFTYDQIQLEATYRDDQGRVLETDKLVVRQKLPPGDEKLIGSVDFKSRGAAKSGTLKVVSA